MARKFDYILGKLRQKDPSDLCNVDEVRDFLSNTKIELRKRFKYGTAIGDQHLLLFKIPNVDLVDYLNPKIVIMRYQTKRKTRKIGSAYHRSTKGWGMACGHIDGTVVTVDNAAYTFSRHNAGIWQTINNLSYNEFVNLIYVNYVNKTSANPKTYRFKQSGSRGKRKAYFGFAIRVDNPEYLAYKGNKNEKAKYLYSDIAKVQCVLSDANIGIGIINTK